MFNPLFWIMLNPSGYNIIATQYFKEVIKLTLKSVTAAALQEALQVGTDDVVLDVREKEEYAAGHIKESFNYPLSELSERADSLKKDTSYYVICQRGMRSEKAAHYLHDLGYDVTNVEGGMDSWQGEIEQ